MPKPTDVYQKVQNDSARQATPHQLISMLFEGLVISIYHAKNHIETEEYEKKAAAIDKALDIIAGLRTSLKFNEDTQDIANNLNDLYMYSEIQLVRASAENDVKKLEEVNDIIHQIKEAWDEISPDK